MDVFLKGKDIPKGLRESFNRSISSLRVAADLGLCMEAAENWWKNEASANLAPKPSKSGISGSPKPKSKGKKAEKKTEDEEESAPHGMKPAQDVISRILWDKRLPMENFTVGYIDR